MFLIDDDRALQEKSLLPTVKIRW